MADEREKEEGGGGGEGEADAGLLNKVKEEAMHWVSQARILFIHVLVDSNGSGNI